MKERIEAKIEEIIDLIIKKPTEEITLDDYTILTAELRDIRFREDQEANRTKFTELMATSFAAGFAPTAPVK